MVGSMPRSPEMNQLADNKANQMCNDGHRNMTANNISVNMDQLSSLTHNSVDEANETVDCSTPHMCRRAMYRTISST